MARQTPLSRAARERAGRRAEWLAELLLRLKFYRILDRRFRSGRGEIDIVARRGKTLTFVEVKSRPTREAAFNALTPAGERRIADAAIIWMSRYSDMAPDEVRYDLVTVARLWPRHHRDVFRPGRDPRDPSSVF
ncbi:MAG: YraN family protein [Pseudomonadota bacterium]